MNNIQGKVWGNTQLLFSKNNVEIHRIEAKKGGFCSKHSHDSKFNAFFVEKGSLLIKIWKNDYDLVDETVISTGQMTIVKPKEYHLFQALEDTIAYEIYWVELNQNDIIRETIGGVEPNSVGKNAEIGWDWKCPHCMRDDYVETPDGTFCFYCEKEVPAKTTGREENERSVGRMVEKYANRLNFSERRDLGRLLDKWMDDNKVVREGLGYISALQALGFEINETLAEPSDKRGSGGGMVDKRFRLNPDAPLTKFIRDFKADDVRDEVRAFHTEYHVNKDIAGSTKEIRREDSL